MAVSLMHAKIPANHQEVKCLPSYDQFRKELLAVGKSAGGSHYGSERQELDQEKANRLVDEELRRLD